MGSIPDEIIDPVRVKKYLVANIDKFECVKPLERYITQDEEIYSHLEDVIIKIFKLRSINSENVGFIVWVLGLNKSLTREKWTEITEDVVNYIEDDDCDSLLSSNIALKLIEAEIMKTEEFFSIINKLHLSVVIKILPHFVRTYDKVVGKFLSDYKDRAKLLSILCEVCRLDLNLMKSHLEDTKIRELIEDLVEDFVEHSNSLHRRQARFLLQVCLEYDDERDNGMKQRCEVIVSLLEVAEEKQVHILQPVISKLMQSLQDTACVLPVRWSLCAFARLFSHQTSWVVRNVMIHFFSLHTFHQSVIKAGRQCFFTSRLIDALDNSNLFSRFQAESLGEPSKLGTELEKFLKTLEASMESNSFTEFLQELITSICSKQEWNSIPLLYISKAVLSLSERQIISDINPIFQSLATWKRFQEPLIRRVIIRLWFQIVCKFRSPLLTAQKLLPVFTLSPKDLLPIQSCLSPLIQELDLTSITEVNIVLPVQMVLLYTKDVHEFKKFCRSSLDNHLMWKSFEGLLNTPQILSAISELLEEETCLRACYKHMENDATPDEVKNIICEVLSQTGKVDQVQTDTLPMDRCTTIFLKSFNKSLTAEDRKILLQALLKTDPSGGDMDIDWETMFGESSFPLLQETLLNLCNTENAASMFTIASSLLPLASTLHTIKVFQLLVKSLNLLEEVYDIDRIVLLAWKTCLELRKSTNLFSQGLTEVMEILFNRHVVNNKDLYAKMRNEMNDYIECVPRFAERFYLRLLRHIDENYADLPYFMNEVVKGMCYGPTFRKDQRTVFDTESYLINDYEDLKQLTECLSGVNVRAKCISYALRRFSPEEATSCITSLCELDKAVSSTRKRYFNNSNIHRVKTRAWQCILVMLDICEVGKENANVKSRCVSLKEEITQQLMNDSHQMTVRILMEWCASKIIKCLALDVKSIISDAIQKASEERIGCICSFLNILMHSCILKDDHPCALVAECLPLILPWMMAQHFAVRIHAQFVFKRLINLCRCFQSCFQSYFPQLKALQEIINYGGGARNAVKLDTDFYMSQCHLEECETFGLLFDDIPKSYGLTDIDSVPQGLFYPHKKWGRKSAVEVHTDVQLEIVNLNNDKPDETTVIQEENYQRKIVPIVRLIEEEKTDMEIKSEKDCDGLVVVASLIDRLPNLGGMSRTSEIFGVSELTLPNIKMIEMKDFQNLSVSSHNWLPIRGVPVCAIEEYLAEKKSKGYTLIGVEQTAQSVSLEKFKFPKKSLLLLGNEKEGMPIHLIHLMDFCVEIPQQGVVRSLNVHVSAAILIWEYRKQFLTCTQ